MNKPTDMNTEKIKHLLNRSITQLDQPVLAKLRHARDQAVARHVSRRVSPALAWAGNFSWGHSPQKIHFWAAALLVIAFLLGTATYWNQEAAESDTSDVDIAILTDDLPMDVYID